MDEQKLKAFFKKDLYANFLYKDFLTNGMDEKRALQTMYNIIQQESGMLAAYNRC
ncbi:MAG: hypothetical protein N2A99_04070 [Carnobacterium alterfunditum]